MGRPAYTPLGPARLAWAANAPIVVFALIRSGDRFEVVIEDPIWPDRSRRKADELVRLTQEWSRRIEAHIRTWPGQWPWFHDRWKTTPELLASKGRGAAS
jgi:KDO2-lipid IV(A) lauroyltransferase